MGILLERTFPKRGDMDALRSGVFNIFQAHGNEFDARLKTERMSGRPGVKRRSGHLASGWNNKTTLEGNSIETTNWLTGPAAEQDGRHGYGWVQENGKDIVPVKSKNLWIPTEENRTPTGVARISPTEAIQRGGFVAKNVFFGKTLFKTQRASSMALRGAKGLKGHIFEGKEKLVPLFILVKRVSVPARLGASDLWNSMRPGLERELDERMQVAL